MWKRQVLRQAVLQFCLGLTEAPRTPRLYVNLRSKASFVAILDLNKPLAYILCWGSAEQSNMLNRYEALQPSSTSLPVRGNGHCPRIAAQPPSFSSQNLLNNSHLSPQPQGLQFCDFPFLRDCMQMGSTGSSQLTHGF